MKPLRLRELTLIVTNGLAEKYPTEQFLPEEMEDALLGVVNSVGLSALNEAIRVNWNQADAGVSPDEFQATAALETSSGFVTNVCSYETITHLIEDMSGLDFEKAMTVLGLVEQVVNVSVFGTEAEAPSEIDFEGIGVISAGATARSYHIELAETLRVPPLKHISTFSSLIPFPRASAASSTDSGV